LQDIKMRLLENAIKSIQLGVQDFTSRKSDRTISAVRNLYAGILLLFKEKLLRLSPPNTEEVLLKEMIVPCKTPDGSVIFKGVGKKTANLFQIKTRFDNLGIKVDWDRVDTLSRIRNALEHYYIEESRQTINEVVSNTFIIIRDFVIKELGEDPLELLGEKVWNILLDVSEVYEKEFMECRQAMDALNWQLFDLREAMKKASCDWCSSSLIMPIYTDPDDYETIDFKCKSCGNTMSFENIAESCLKEYFSWDIYSSIKDGGESPLVQCPNCLKESYIVEEDKCAICGYERKYHDCVRCGASLEVWEQDFGGFCSYCDHVMAKNN